MDYIEKETKTEQQEKQTRGFPEITIAKVLCPYLSLKNNNRILVNGIDINLT